MRKEERAEISVVVVVVFAFVVTGDRVLIGHALLHFAGKK